MIGKRFSMHIVAAMAAMVCITNPASAEVTFAWATVGNPANAEDPLNAGDIPGIGSVNNRYRIAKHEVTNDQYAEFLNAVAGTDTNGLYNANMGWPPHVLICTLRGPRSVGPCWTAILSILCPACHNRETS